MAEYIEREATCRDCFHFDVCDYHITELTTMTVNECSHKFVNKADVVEVVRCKDCKYWGGVTFGYICRRFSGTTLRNETRESDYCSYGEKNGENSLLYADLEEIIDATN